MSMFPSERSRQIVAHSELAGENYFVRAFPCLFPYGMGGVEGEQIRHLSMQMHVRTLLQRADKRFRKHPSFAFVALGILQRRQAMNSAKIQVHLPYTLNDAFRMQNITPEEFQRATEQETLGQHISNPVIRSLRKQVTASARRVQGSDYARTSMRSHIWSTCMMYNPPSVWLTINPNDLHDPVAQVFIGENIDLDEFDRQTGPSKQKRAENVAGDPYGSAKYFHYIIRLLIEEVIGVKVEKGCVSSSYGIFGKVSAYFGAVETQGRGSLHIHLLLWLCDAPSASEMRQKLKHDNFKRKVRAFIHANFCAYMPGLESLDAVNSIPNETDVAFSRPPNPFDFEHFEEEAETLERRVARSQQLHTCSVGRCLVRMGQVVACKRRAPFECSGVDEIKEDGTWKMK